VDENFTLRLDDQLCFALYAATNAVTRSYRARLETVGLTYPQYLVMLVLWQDGPSPISHIAARLSLAPNAITPLLDKLEKIALVKRKRNEADRRVIRIELTEKGVELEHETALKQHQTPPPKGRVKHHNPVQPVNADKFV